MRLQAPASAAPSTRGRSVRAGASHAPTSSRAATWREDGPHGGQPEGEDDRGGAAEQREAEREGHHHPHELKGEGLGDRRGAQVPCRPSGPRAAATSSLRRPLPGGRRRRGRRARRWSRASRARPADARGPGRRWGMFVRARRQLVRSLDERARRAEAEQELLAEQGAPERARTDRARDTRRRRPPALPAQPARRAPEFRPDASPHLRPGVEPGVPATAGADGQADERLVSRSPRSG